MSMNRPGDLAALNGLSHLDDPLRRQLYECVIESDGPVSREQAAAAASIGRTLAAYHLDKLAEAGLLTVSYQRPAGRGGPGPGARRSSTPAPPGRSPSACRPATTNCSPDYSSHPSSRTPAERCKQAVNSAAHEAGRRAGAETGGSVVGALRDCGYLPHADDDGRINLRNCPFHLVAQDHRDVVCGLNLRLVEGVIAGCGHPHAHAELDPATDRCCVVVHDAQPSARTPSPTQTPSSRTRGQRSHQTKRQSTMTP